MSSFDATMETLKARFVARAAEDRDRLRSCQDTRSPELRSLVHRLAGSAGLFGFSTISTLAATVDAQLAQGGDGETLPELLAALDTLVARDPAAR